MTKVLFRDRVLQAREGAILASVNRLLADKGYDAMTVDEVATDVGIGKASLYRHFRSKEALAAAAMVGVLDRALAFVSSIDAPAKTAAIDKLRAIARWAMLSQLAGEMPMLPVQNSGLRAALGANQAYLERLNELSEKLGRWIAAAQKAGTINRSLPPELVLYTLFARACDPVLSLLKAGGNHSDDKIVTTLLAACFDGLSGGRRAPPA